MNRATPYRSKASEQIKERIQQTLNTTMYLVQTTGPTSYVIQEQDNDQKFKVLVGSMQTCSCGEPDLCMHILFVMLKVFRVPATTPIVWQKSLIDSEIEMLLRGDYREKSRPAPRAANAFLKRKENSSKNAAGASSPDDGNSQPDVQRHELAEGEVCAICQEDMDTSQALTFCRKGCGNNFHIECMKVYGESRRQSKDTIWCPLCRQDWGENALQQLRQENDAANRLPHVHQATCCKRCKSKPIRNERYRCVQCPNVDLCSRCFQSNSHKQHAFVMKKHVDDRWVPAFTPQQLEEKKSRLSNAQLAELQTRELSTNDYDLLLQLDRVDSTSLEKFLLSVVPGQKVAAANTKTHEASNSFCFICQQSLRLPVDLRTISCGHSFHESCLERHILAQKYSCPFAGCELVLFPGLANVDNSTKKKHSDAHHHGPSTDPATSNSSESAMAGSNLLGASLCITSISQNAGNAVVHHVPLAENTNGSQSRRTQAATESKTTRGPPPPPVTKPPNHQDLSFGLHSMRLMPSQDVARPVLLALNENQREEQQQHAKTKLPTLCRPTIRHGLASAIVDPASTSLNASSRLLGAVGTNETIEVSDRRIEQAAKFRCEKQAMDKERRRRDRMEREAKHRVNIHKQQLQSDIHIADGSTSLLPCIVSHGHGSGSANKQLDGQPTLPQLIPSATSMPPKPLPKLFKHCTTSGNRRASGGMVKPCTLEPLELQISSKDTTTAIN